MNSTQHFMYGAAAGLGIASLLSLTTRATFYIMLAMVLFAAVLEAMEKGIISDREL